MEYSKSVDDYVFITEQSVGTNRVDELQDLSITFLCDGKHFADSLIYNRVPKAKIQIIEKKLQDYTQHNANIKCLCEAVTLITIISEIEKVIYDC